MGTNNTNSMSAHTPGPFDAFTANPTPANAVRLAIADHRAGDARDELFLRALERAAVILEGNTPEAK